MANVFASELVPDRVADMVMTTLTARLAPLSAFARDFSLDPLRRKATVQVPLASVTDQARQDPTDFEVGDSNLGNIPVPVYQVSKSWHVTNLEVQEGFRVEQTAQANANRFADTITALALHPLNSVGYEAFAGNPVTTDSFGVAEAKQAWGQLFGPGPNNLILARAYAANLQPSDRQWFNTEGGAYGFQAIHTNELWQTTITDPTPTADVVVGAPTGVVGIALHPQAIAIASGMPTNLAAPQGEYWVNRTLTLQNGMSVQLLMWFSRGSRTVWASLDVMFGAAQGDFMEGTATEGKSCIVIAEATYVEPTSAQAVSAPPPAAKQAPVKNGKTK